MNELNTVMGGKFNFFAQDSDFAPFIGNGIKITSEIKPPLLIVLNSNSITKSKYVKNYSLFILSTVLTIVL